MNQTEANQSERPRKINVDIEQWRRDIKTFADTTNEALAAIAAELSSKCSSGLRSFGSNHQFDNSGHTPETTASDAGGDRLADLKARLSERLSKPE